MFQTFPAYPTCAYGHESFEPLIGSYCKFY